MTPYSHRHTCREKGGVGVGLNLLLDWCFLCPSVGSLTYLTQGGEGGGSGGVGWVLPTWPGEGGRGRGQVGGSYLPDLESGLTGRHSHPFPCWQTNTTETITLSRTSYVVGNKRLVLNKQKFLKLENLGRRCYYEVFDFSKVSCTCFLRRTSECLEYFKKLSAVCFLVKEEHHRLNDH